MKYEVGDDIIVLHTSEEGKVIEIINEKMVLIEIRGVKFPAYMDQIDFPYFYRFTKKKVEEPKKPKVFLDNIPKEKPQPSTIKVEDGVWLVLIPKFSMDEFNDEVVDSLKIYLVNKTKTAYTFTYKQNFLNESNFEIRNQVGSFQDFYLHDIDFEKVNDSPSFSVDFGLIVPEKKKQEHYEAILKLKPKQLFNRIEEMKEKNLPTLPYKLFDKYPEKQYEEKFDISHLTSKGAKMYDVSHARKNLAPHKAVVDLHIEKLSNNWESMASSEILDMQLSEFEKWYDSAIAHRESMLIIIHGLGSGRLKDEVHEILKTKPEVKSFMNKYDPRFGYGATEILFEYK